MCLDDQTICYFGMKTLGTAAVVHKTERGNKFYERVILWKQG